MKEKVAPLNTNLGIISSEEYMDSYNGIKCELKSSVHFDESTDIAITYLGLENMTLAKAGGVMDIPLDSGASKSHMSKSFYLRNTHLCHILKFISNTRSIQVSSGQLMGALFIIPIVYKIGRQLFEIYTLVSKYRITLTM